MPGDSKRAWAGAHALDKIKDRIAKLTDDPVIDKFVAAPETTPTREMWLLYKDAGDASMACLSDIVKILNDTPGWEVSEAVTDESAKGGG